MASVGITLVRVHRQLQLQHTNTNANNSISGSIRMLTYLSAASIQLLSNYDVFSALDFHRLIASINCIPFVGVADDDE